MKTLIVYAHPNIQGNCSAILESVKKNLKDKKIDFDILDLYAKKFDPVLHEEEFHPAGGKKIGRDVKDIQKKLSRINQLIFIYPVWWGAEPAILRGFFDRVFSKKFAFDFNKYGFPKPLLKGKRALVLLSSGASTFFARFVFNMHDEKSIKDTLKFVGIKPRLERIGGAKDKVDEKRLAKIDKIVTKAVNKFAK